MNSYLHSSADTSAAMRYIAYQFITETIEVEGVTPLSFFEAGAASYKGQRMFWQNPERDFSLIGIGHAHVLKTSNLHGRFEDVQTEWKAMCSRLPEKELLVRPSLFGGFSFDPLNPKKSEWVSFPETYFALPVFQLQEKDGKTFISIHQFTKELGGEHALPGLRKKRDELIQSAKRLNGKVHSKQVVESHQELHKDVYMESIDQVTAAIKAGQAAKVVIARCMELAFKEQVTAAAALSQVSKEQTSSYLFGIEAEEQFFFGATPERLVKVEKGMALSTCLAGSTRRGKDEKEDLALGAELLLDRKNRSEHQYVVDMIDQVFKEHCEGVNIPQKPELMKIRDIQHLHTPVRGSLKDGAGLMDLVKSLHPTPALGGEPKQQALSLIRQYETMNRGFYAAPVGWMDSRGDGEFAVAIRSALLDGKRAFLYAGGGIVANSTPQSEYAETWVKFRPMLRALGGQMRDES